MEYWKKIKDFEDYSISNYGNVRNNKTKRLLKAGLNKAGYRYICLSKNGKKYMFRVCRLVGEYFVPKRRCSNEINHLDRNRQNDVSTNLEWTTHKKNILYSKARKVIRVNATRKHIKKTYKSIEEAIKDNHISTATLYKIVKENKLYKNHYWYIQERK